MKISTRKLVVLAMLTALAVVLVALVHFPIFPVAPFLEYDPADIPIFVGTFLFGPYAGLVLTAVVSVIQGVTVSASGQWIGILMHFFATGSFVVTAGFIYKNKKTKTRAIIALICGVLAMTVSMVLWNALFTPIYMGVPRSAVMDLMLPAIIPFNLIKAGVNAIVAFIVYKAVSRLVKGRFLAQEG